MPYGKIHNEQMKIQLRGKPILDKELIRPLKKAKTFDEQLDILEERKLLIDDREYAKKVLSKVNYYRLSGYFIYFYVPGKEEFRQGTKFEEMYNLYKFDIELRRLFMELTEEIEINFRTYISYYIAHNFGEDGHLDKENFYNKDYHDEFVQILGKKAESYKDKAYIKHHKDIYNGNMPIWVAVEILSFTDLSKLYSNMKNSDREKIIYNNYKDRDVVKNADIVRFWIQSLSEIRNKCAHYERLYDSKLKKDIRLPKQYKSKAIKTNSLFASIIIFKILINDEMLWDNFIERFEDIVSKYEFKKFHNMGFIKGWKSILTRKKTR